MPAAAFLGSPGRRRGSRAVEDLSRAVEDLSRAPGRREHRASALDGDGSQLSRSTTVGAARRAHRAHANRVGAEAIVLEQRRRRLRGGARTRLVLTDQSHQLERGRRRWRELGDREGCQADLEQPSPRATPMPSPRPPASASTAPARPPAHRLVGGARVELAGLTEAEGVGVDMPAARRRLRREPPLARAT